MNINDFSQLIAQYWLIAFVIGLIISFFGYYLLRTSLAIVGFVSGMYAGQYLWIQLTTKYNLNFNSSNEQMIHIGAVLLIAFLSTTLFITLYKLAVFAVGFVAGGAIMYYFYNWVVSAFKINVTVGNNSKLVELSVFLIFGLIVGLVTLKSEKKAVGTALAVIGALMASYSVMIPLLPRFNVKTSTMLKELTDGKHMLMLTIFITIFLVLSILSVKFQIGRKKDGNSSKGD